MKFNGIPGERAFKALYAQINTYYINSTQFTTSKQWLLSAGYFFNKKEVLEYFGTQEVVWPVEEDEYGVYVPSQEELE